MSLMLENKVAVIYGAGSIGRAVAQAFVREGAQVFLGSRSKDKFDILTNEMSAAGGAVETRVIDAYDQAAVDAYVDSIVAQTGRLDISFNLISVGDVQKPLMDLSADDFLQPITNTMRTQFLTTHAAARHMIKQGSGVILAFGGGGPQTIAGMGGYKVSLDALESLRRQWSVELGPHGIRVVTLKTGGILESISEDFPQRDELVAALTEPTLLKRTATLADVGNVAAFVASDLARSLTATDVNISCGAIID
jgi:3-oxoacyl-[acyl-carrier protein] reductase